MAPVWVKAKSIVRVDEAGQMKTYVPGDWCQMGKHQAREYLSRGQIEILRPAVLQSVQDLHDCSILTSEPVAEPALSNLAAMFPGVPIQMQNGTQPKQNRYLLWDQSANLRRDLILTGFKLLEKWQLAVPLLDYDTLAENIGTDQERQETKAIIHDLRVPVYDCRVLFVRQCKETRKLFRLWSDGTQLGFLQALYQAKPIVNALPPTWIMA